MYVNCQSAVRTAHGLTKWFEVKTGVRQGCVLSPLLFITYMDKISTAANTDSHALNDQLFADDQSIIPQEVHKLQEHVNALDDLCNQFNMKINTEKTEIMKITKTRSPINVFIGNNKIKQAKGIQISGQFIHRRWQIR